MAIIRFKGLIFFLLLVLFYTTLPIAVLISVAALALTGTHLSSFTIFTLLLGLDTIKFAFCNSLSMSVYNVADAKVALDRIQFFLKEKEPEVEKGKQYQTERLFSEEPLNVVDNLVLRGKGSTEIEMTVLLSDSSDRVDSANLITDTFADSSSVSTRANNMSSANVYTIPSVDTSMAHVTSGLITSHERSTREPFVSISEVSCSWNQDSFTDTFTLRSVTLNVYKGEILAITGPVGSGKSSLLTAVLREIPVREGTISYFGKVSYVPQIPWIFSGTVRENILFGLPFNEEKFQQIVNICGLTKDLVAFSNGDLTEIGQRGATLSGGQRARVGLARALYSDADIYLLDDPLSAVDAKVGRNLFKNCILQYLSGHIRLLVTHQLQYLKDLDRIAVMKNGTITHQGGYSELADQGVFSGMLDVSQRLEDDPVRARSVSLYEFNKRVTSMQKPRATTSASHEIRHDMELHKLLEEDVTSVVSVGFMKGESTVRSTRSRSCSPVSECDVPIADHRPVLDLKEEEEIKTTGTVTWRLYWDYFKAGVQVPFIILLAFVLIAAQVFLVGPNWWLSRMAKMPHEQQKAPVTQGIYTSLVVVSIVVMAASCFFFYYILLKAAENLHNKMTVSAIKAPVLFYDSNPAGRILNRFSKDVGCMDDELPPLFLQALTTCLTSLCAMLVPAATNYWLFLALLPILTTVAFYARYYLKSSRELKRIEAIKCSPVYSHITETANGLEIVHVSNMSRTFLERLQRYQDENTQAFFMVVSCNRWLAIRIDLLCSVFVITVAVTAIFIGENSVLAGLALTYALQTLDETQYGVRVATQVENLMTSVERVMAYTKIDSESGYSIPHLPPGSWPSEGRLDIQNLSLVYFHGGPRILKDINVCIASKAKIGVVGRTGAGKSSLVSALFRMPDPLGKVLIDGVDIGSVNLQEARKSMAVITQDTVLFGGTLKRNMDPLSQYTDQELWTALGEVQLKTVVEGLPGQLQFKLRESGTNFSVGERQLVCLARALVQKSKIIIMDEATANVDFKTDRLIQEVIRHKFKDSTVITIAHRLNTILDYDKVLVLDGGRVVEFDKPDVLIRKGGLFSEMIRSQTQRGKD